MKKKIQKIYLTQYNSLIAQDLWETSYQILPLIILKQFNELNVNLNAMIKDVKLVELNKSTVTVFLNKKVLEMIQQNTNVPVANKTINTGLM